MNITNNVFDNVYYGLSGLNGTTHTIRGNQFTIPDSYGPDAPMKSFGVRFDGGAAFDVSDNVFRADNQAHATFGVIAATPIAISFR